MLEYVKIRLREETAWSSCTVDVLQNAFNRCFHLELLVFLVFDISNPCIIRGGSAGYLVDAVCTRVQRRQGDKETYRPCLSIVGGVSAEFNLFPR